MVGLGGAQMDCKGITGLSGRQGAGLMLARGDGACSSFRAPVCTGFEE